ncbi:FAD-binding oxidoreductase [Acetobacteraceae bacterium ESL0709]|nr:FAD-binding oxidoreductase [Acetobacteraceae bacterium ESL0697]MDF7678157.1 FAD-binding oxidoreductase [Acetobacteraceae bacterium ESL0709]
MDSRLSNRSVIVIGGGVVARCCALSLRRQGVTVTLLAIPDEYPASYGNAGHIATEQVDPLSQWSMLASMPFMLFPKGPISLNFRDIGVWLPWSVRFLRACFPGQAARGSKALRWLQSDALAAWERLDQCLSEGEGGKSVLVRDGTKKIWEGKDSAQRAETALRANYGAVTARPMTADECHAITSALNMSIVAGVYYDETAHVTSPSDVLVQLARRFREMGGIWRDGTATRIAPDERGVSVSTSEGQLRADDVILAGGVTSGRILTGLKIPIIAERGYHIEWDHGGAYTLPNLVFEDRSMVVTCFGKRLRATSFVEFTRAEAPPDARKWVHLEHQVRSLGLPVASSFSRWHGSRPTLPDYLPMMGGIAGMPHVFAAFGHNHLGLTLAPTTAERMTSLLLKGDLLPEALSPDRFGIRTV